ncbi:sulfite oxidase subunit YedZ [Enterobacter cloacae]|uniref:Sulfite oxidase subunit YedZ n=1 Tax=Enterobacter cloacae TaxID=550 RepID=A0A377LTR8_ENTCL|nr:sulfite oxidase subunit YedZ [Enterobacter cloacae]
MVFRLGHVAPDQLRVAGTGINNLALLGRELVTRPYLTLGIVSWLVLLALALTSTQYAQRKLGKRWQLLHNFVYLVAILAPSIICGP